MIPLALLLSSLIGLGHFEEWKQKPFDLASLFLSPNPTVFEMGQCREPLDSSLWPEAVVLSQKNDSDLTIDLVRLGKGADVPFLKETPEILSSAQVIYMDMSPAQDDRAFFEQSAFQLLSQWPSEETAIFVKNTFFCNQETANYLLNHSVSEPAYKKYYVPLFDVYYYLDDERDSIKTHFLKHGLSYEKDIGKIIHELTKKGSVAIDIGAHIGVHTLTMSKKTGPQGAVVAFEPNKKLYMELLSTLDLNHCNNVIPIAKGLGETAKTVFLKNIKIEEEEFVLQPGDSLDSIDLIPLDSLNLDNVSLIKIDVENYEYSVLKGAEKTLSKNHPVILFECWIGRDYNNSDPKEKANFDRVLALMEAYGYEVYVIYSNDFIAFPFDPFGEFSNAKKNFRRLDLNHFDLGIR